MRHYLLSQMANNFHVFTEFQCSLNILPVTQQSRSVALPVKKFLSNCGFKESCDAALSIDFLVLFEDKFLNLKWLPGS